MSIGNCRDINHQIWYTVSASIHGVLTGGLLTTFRVTTEQVASRVLDCFLVCEPQISWWLYLLRGRHGQNSHPASSGRMHRSLCRPAGSSIPRLLPHFRLPLRPQMPSEDRQIGRVLVCHLAERKGLVRSRHESETDGDDDSGCLEEWP